MKKRIVSVYGFHEWWVRNAVDDIQRSGNYEVVDVKRIRSMKFGLFGEDVTEIEYKEK